MTEKEQEKLPEIVSDQERELAQYALTDFKKKNYNACLQHLNKLDSKNNDLKVLHNRAVVEYFKSDCKKIEQFQKSVTALCNQFRVKFEKLDEIDYCIAQFNQAVLLYYQRQYSASQRIMEKVYKFIEPMDESLAKQVSLLAIELQLCLRQPDKALTFINYLENVLMYGGNIPLKILDKTSKEKKIQLPPPKPIPEEFSKKLMKYKVRCYLMNHSLNTALKELQVLMKDKSNLEALFLLANFEYLKGNLKESVKILASIPTECFSYSQFGESSNVMIYNNMGILHHAMGKPNLACHYYQMALKEDIKNQNSLKKDESPLHTLGGSKYHEIMYNLGISLLYAGKPTQAFDCLIIAVRRYHRNSRLWMRLAECCIMVHKETNETDFDIQKKQKELVVDVVGSKEKRKIVLTSNLSKDKKYSSESQSYAVPVPSLEFASLCLRNASLLIPSDADTPSVPLFLIPGVTPPAPPPSPSSSPSNPLTHHGIAILRNGVLVASAYVSLCLGDYILSLEYSKELLEQPEISGAHRLLAHLYAAESLVLLDNIPGALEHLNPENVKDISFTIALENELIEGSCMKTNPPLKWFPNALASAHSVMQYNIAVAKTIRGQLDQAGTILKQIWQLRSPVCKVPAHIIILVIYIELQLGHTDIARKLIMQHSLQHRLNG